MVGYRKKILYNSLMFVILLQTGFTRAVKQGRYQRELLFDGVLPKNTSYYSNVFESLTHLACACKCCTNYPICVGYLYSSSLMRCRLLRKFLGESEKANDYNGSGWEYRSIEVNNLALRKAVISSSISLVVSNTTLTASVDGLTDTTSWTELFQTDYEYHPWLTINLGGLSIIKNVVLYNRKDEHGCGACGGCGRSIKDVCPSWAPEPTCDMSRGRWLHNVEIRVGNSFTWSEMELCGLFVGPSQTGKVHTIECGTLLYGTYVTAKMVELNYISDDLVTSVGKDILVLEEIVVNGLFV